MKKMVLKNKSDPSEKITTHYKFDEPNIILIFFEDLTLKIGVPLPKSQSSDWWSC